ncbi:MAG: phage tail protein [Ruminococcus sp.]|nr:phage tail protein [Ruminococcus sp.]
MAWVIQGGKLTNTDFLEIPDKPFVGDSPYTMWRIDPDINNGRPFSPLMIGLPSVQMYIQPSRPLIHAYSSRETDFNGNGYAVIEPISCEIRSEKNGVYEASFETYCDKYGKYTYLRKQAQVKIPMRYHGETTFQIFRIRQYNRRMDAAGNYRITATAQHKFYELSRRLIKDCRPTQLSGNAALKWLFEHGWYGGNSDTGFDYSSNIGAVRTAYYENCSVTAALLGVDQCFVNRWGGCLYRDNNYFSINSEMEGCRKSGIIMYSYNMTEIDFQEDDSELITILEAEDNFGNVYTITNSAVPTEDIPYHIYGYARFTYDEEDVALFHADAQAYFNERKQSKVNITVRFANLSDIEKYKQFLQLDDFEVGDKITLYHKELDIYYSNLEIISKTFDVVAQKTMEIEIGSFKDAVTRRAYMADTISSGSTVGDKTSAALEQGIYDSNTKTMASNVSGMECYTIVEIEKRSIAELEG